MFEICVCGFMCKKNKKLKKKKKKKSLLLCRNNNDQLKQFYIAFAGVNMMKNNHKTCSLLQIKTEKRIL